MRSYQDNLYGIKVTKFCPKMELEGFRIWPTIRDDIRCIRIPKIIFRPDLEALHLFSRQ